MRCYKSLGPPTGPHGGVSEIDPMGAYVPFWNIVAVVVWAASRSVLELSCMCAVLEHRRGCDTQGHGVASERRTLNGKLLMKQAT